MRIICSLHDAFRRSYPKAGSGSLKRTLSRFRPRLEPLEDRTLLATSVLFHHSTGELVFRGDAAENTVRSAITRDGFLQVTLDGQRLSSDPASPFFQNCLGGANLGTLARIRFDGDSHDTLILSSQSLAGNLGVSAAGATVVTENVTVNGQLTIQAQNITVSGALRASAIALTGSGWVTVEATGSLAALPLSQPAPAGGVNGGRIDVATDVFVNSGQLHANGLTGGEVVVSARNVLNGGPITADGNGPNGSGGAVRIAFTDSYIDTLAAVASANGALGLGGSLTINGGRTGRLFTSGNHQATGSAGGSIDHFGRELMLVGAQVDASGNAGGGSIRIGGDYQGRLVGHVSNVPGRTGHVQNVPHSNAQSVTVTSSTMIRADALHSGDGGRVIVWADEETRFDGVISARGGPNGGAGGFIEVSAKGNLTYRGTADADAPAGKAGTLLLDPKNLIISAAPVGVFPQFDLIDPHPALGGRFGTSVVPLSSGNLVVSDPDDNFGGLGAGAVYLFSGRTGALISLLIGTVINGIGLNVVTVLPNGNYVVSNPEWNVARGAVTWGSGAAGVSGVVSAANSIVGGAAFDRVGGSGVLVLSNGNYLIRSRDWNNARGAVTWGSGTAGVSGVVSATNSLVGSSPNESVGASFAGTPSAGVIPLTNGNYVVSTPAWNGGRGAVTWGSGTIGITGVLSEVNSLVGTNANDHVGGGVAGGVITLSNGGYVVHSREWNGRRGAATWGSGTGGVTGPVSETNSLVGTSPDESSGGIVPLSNGNYVVVADFWNDQRGAVTWGSGMEGVRGVISAAQSLVGSNPGDHVGRTSILALSNGNYVVRSPLWSGQRGAVTWGSGTEGVHGVISSANSLVGSNAGELLGAVTALSNGDFVVTTPTWNSNSGAVTWGSGTTGVSGTISADNSLVGNTGDRVGIRGITSLSNGNYVVPTPTWNFGRGAVTWVSGAEGTRGVVSAANSLVGTNANDQVGTGGITVLSNANYVVSSPVWNFGRGAVTLGDGTSGITGGVSADNSLVGSNSADRVGGGRDFGSGIGGVVGLSSGNYVVRSPLWNNERGAVTWGSGTQGVTGVVSPLNSLVGSSTGDLVGGGFGAVTALSNGNYVVRSLEWSGRRAAVSWGDGAKGLIGVVSASNSLVGSNPNDLVGNRGITALSNGNYVVRGEIWNGGRGAVTWGSGTSGVSGPVSAANSLVGSNPNDFVGGGDGLILLSNDNYLVRSLEWNVNRGAVTWGNGSAGVTGAVSAANSLVGSNPGYRCGRSC